MKKEAGRLIVVHALPGSPAEKAGLRGGDELLQIDRQPVPGKLFEVVLKLRGAAGTLVGVKVRRKDGTEAELAITRGPIQVPALRGLRRTGGDAWQYWIDSDQKLAYMQIAFFNSAAVSQTRELIGKLKQQGLKGLVLDLRDSPGGILAAAVDFVGLFQKEGKLLIVKGRQGDEVYSAKGQSWQGDFPLVVLIDGTTTSAAEVVAGALQEHGRAVLVGDRTFGKGSVQSLISVDGGETPEGDHGHHGPARRPAIAARGRNDLGHRPERRLLRPPFRREAKQAARSARQHRDSSEAVASAKLSSDAIASELADVQLAAAVKTLSAKVCGGEFVKVGHAFNRGYRPLSAGGATPRPAANAAGAVAQGGKRAGGLGEIKDKLGVFLELSMNVTGQTALERDGGDDATFTN